MRAAAHDAVGLSCRSISLRTFAAQGGWLLWLWKCTSHTALRVQVGTFRAALCPNIAFALRSCDSAAGPDLKLTILQLELRQCASRTTFALKAFEFRAGAGALFACHFLHTQIAIFEPELRTCSSRATSAIQSCDSRVGAAGNRSRDQAIAKVGAPQYNVQRPFHKRLK